MKTFPNWRAVGKALRAVRARHGDTLAYTRRRTTSGVMYRKWKLGDTIVRTMAGLEPSGLISHVQIIAGPTVAELTTGDTRAVLDLLASLELIPVHLSSGYAVGAIQGRGVAALELAEMFTGLHRVGER